MRVLLVEDIADKATQVEYALRKAITPLECSIDKAGSFLSAVRQLQSASYDLLILDLVLPMRDNEEANCDSGKQVLGEILADTGCRRPSHIICLTAYEDLTPILKNEVAMNLLHVVVYREGESKWQDALAGKARYVAGRLREADNVPDTYNVDVGIVTSSSQAELREVNKLPGPFVGEFHQRDCLYYYSANWQTADSRKLSAVACAAPSMGMTAACVTACKLIERWRPRFLVMSGIAAGTKKGDQAFGDVLIAETAYDYGSGKIEERDDERLFVPSPRQLHITPNLQSILQRWERDQLRTDEIRRAWCGEQRNAPKLILGILATGAAVVQSKDLVDEILASSRKVVGLDMEAYAIFQAGSLSPQPRPQVLVAKSISDFADNRKNDDWHQYAAFTSARFVYEFFTTTSQSEFGLD